MKPLLEVEGLAKTFAVRRGALRRRVATIRAVDGVDLALSAGETYALVGESGCGKTTLGLCLSRLVEPSRGTIHFRGENLMALGRRDLRRRRRSIQMIFQDPTSSLDPRQRVSRQVGEALRAHGLGDRRWRASEVARLLERVGLEPELSERLPHELSGGQRQRVAIARALAPGPELVVADEPLSALDVSVRAQILGLLAALRRELGLTLLLISHDLALVEQISDRVAVMYLGRLVEESTVAKLFTRPLHPYTVALLSAVPRPDPSRRSRRILLAGDPPSASDPPGGCAFHPRCPAASRRCATESPALVAATADHRVACHHPGELREPAADPGGLPDGTFRKV